MKKPTTSKSCFSNPLVATLAASCCRPPPSESNGAIGLTLETNTVEKSENDKREVSDKVKKLNDSEGSPSKDVNPKESRRSSSRHRKSHRHRDSSKRKRSKDRSSRHRDSSRRSVKRKKRSSSKKRSHSRSGSYEHRRRKRKEHKRRRHSSSSSSRGRKRSSKYRSRKRKHSKSSSSSGSSSSDKKNDVTNGGMISYAEPLSKSNYKISDKKSHPYFSTVSKIRRERLQKEK